MLSGGLIISQLNYNFYLVQVNPLIWFSHFISYFVDYCKDEKEDTIFIGSKQRTILQLRKGICRKREFSLFENIIRKHRAEDDGLIRFVQFRLNEPHFSWSGPICIASLGCFFLKFRKQQSSRESALDDNITEFASVNVVEDGSTVVLHFNKPPNVCLPYRIENLLPTTSITYYQKVWLIAIFYWR